VVKLKEDNQYWLGLDEQGAVSLFHKADRSGLTAEVCAGSAEWNEKTWEILVADWNSVRLVWHANSQSEAVELLWAERVNLNWGYLN
jgi:hypothetical protein